MKEVIGEKLRYALWQTKDTFPRIKPAVAIRPHHFIQSSSVRKALIGQIEPIELDTMYLELAKCSNGWDESSDPSGYHRDVDGSTFGEQTERLLKKQEFLNSLAELPDEAFAHFDLKPDGICASCTIGKHCTGSNYTSGILPRATSLSEEGCLRKIRSALIMGGFELGTDYCDRQTSHILYDYGGRTLANSGKGTPVAVEFESLVVNVGVLREMIPLGFFNDPKSAEKTPIRW